MYIIFYISDNPEPSIKTTVVQHLEDLEHPKLDARASWSFEKAPRQWHVEVFCGAVFGAVGVGGTQGSAGVGTILTMGHVEISSGAPDGRKSTVITQMMIPNVSNFD